MRTLGALRVPIWPNQSGDTPIAFAMIASALGQLCRRTLDKVPGLSPFAIDKRRRLQPQFHSAATTSARDQSFVDALARFVVRFSGDMA